LEKDLERFSKLHAILDEINVAVNAWQNHLCLKHGSFLYNQYRQLLRDSKKLGPELRGNTFVEIKVIVICKQENRLMSEPNIAILWGSETGTAQSLAEKTELTLSAQGFQAKEMDMSDVKVENLTSYQTILVITSTWGDGDPPSNAMDLLGELQARTINLNMQTFSVCALGDTAYYQFCKCGKDFDEALATQGANRLVPIKECDIDYDAPYEQWLENVIQALKAKETSTV